MGIVPLNKFVNEFARKVFKPYLPMTTTLLTCGNTDGWNRIVQTLMNRTFLLPSFSTTQC